MSSTTDEQLWVVCPVCHKANPAGAHFCQHCWGAAIRQDATLTTGELAEASKHRDAYLRRRKTVRLTAIGGGILAVVSIILIGLIYFTDLVIKPVQTLNSSSHQDEWAMFRHDLERTGASGTTGAVPQGTLKWSFPTGVPIRSSPAVADGAVFFGSQDSKAYAIDTETGKTRWSFSAGSWVDSSPSVADGVVYIGSNDGKLYALDIKDGSKVWDFKTAFPVRSAPAIAGETVYFGGDDYGLYALDTATGAKLWSHDLSSPVQSPPVVANGILYVGSADGYSYAFNPSSGQRRLRFQSLYAVYAAPIVVDNTVYFVTTNGHLYAVDGRARTRLWEHEIQPFWIQLYAMGIPGIPAPRSQSGYLWNVNLARVANPEARRANGTVNSSPTVSGDTMVVAFDSTMLAMDLKTQKKIWTFPTKGVIRSSPAISNNVVYFGSDDGNLYAVDATTGKQLWSYETGGPISSSPAVVDGVIYVGSEDGNLYAIK